MSVIDAAAVREAPSTQSTLRDTVSVVIPARNAAHTLPSVLGALAQRPVRWSVTVVDDHSTDDTAAVARAHGAQVIPSRGERNDYAARNTGAAQGDSEFLVFLDADVIATPEVIGCAVERVRSGDAACVFAVYDLGAHLSGLVSRYKNFWIRESTLESVRPLTWINTSLAVMRRETYVAVGGFADDFSRTRGGGDLDFGRRVAEQVGPIYAGEDLAVSHLKRFTLGSLLRNDFNRARGWLRLSLFRRGMRGVVRKPACANVSPGFSLGVVSAAACVALLAASVIFPAARIPAALCAVLQGSIGAPFTVRAARHRVRGWPVFSALLFLDQLACAAGLGTELLARLLRRPHPHRR